MLFNRRELYDIDVDFQKRRLLTGAPEEYTWTPENDILVRKWLKETIDASTLREARENDTDSVPSFLTLT